MGGCGLAANGRAIGIGRVGVGVGDTFLCFETCSRRAPAGAACVWDVRKGDRAAAAARRQTERTMLDSTFASQLIA